MNSQMIAKFKEMFEKQKRDLVYTAKVMNQEFHLKEEDRIDEADLTSSELETQMRMRLRNREALFLKKIDEALLRIERGTFGECADCDGAIEMRRLEARPTATLCVLCKEGAERREKNHIDGHRHKSVGTVLRFRVVS
jgi:DnaK suppressor protein